MSKEKYSYIEISLDGTAWRRGSNRTGEWKPMNKAAQRCLSGDQWPVGRPIRVLREMAEEMESEE